MTSLSPYIAYRCIVGSRAYGLETDASDTDVRGFYLPPARLHWSLTKLPEQLECEERQECIWELEKLLRLALGSNPNVLECLYTPLVEHTSPIAEELREMGEAFLSKLAFERYMGYADAQFRKMEASMQTRGQVKWKHAMHLIRLLIAGEHLLREGRVLVDVRDHREVLLSIKRGERTWEEVATMRAQRSEALQAAASRTTLPEEPDRQRVDDFLIRARRAMVDV
jgi:hypothetical protein